MKPKGDHSLTMAISEQHKHTTKKTPYKLKCTAITPSLEF